MSILSGQLTGQSAHMPTGHMRLPVSTVIPVAKKKRDFWIERVSNLAVLIVVFQCFGIFYAASWSKTHLCFLKANF